MIKSTDLIDGLVMYFVEHGMQVLTAICIPFPQQEVRIIGQER